MMASEQLRAFDVSQEPESVRKEYGDSPFGRGCLAARRLIEVGVRCVEVTLDGWDTHVANHEVHRSKLKVLDPAFAALLRDLKQRKAARAHDRRLLRRVRPHARRSTSAPAGTTGRPASASHSPAARSAAARSLGETDPEGLKDPVRPTQVEDVHATVLTALGLNPAKENIAAATGRPIKLSPGKPIRDLWAKLRPTSPYRCRPFPSSTMARRG